MNASAHTHDGTHRQRRMTWLGCAQAVSEAARAYVGVIVCFSVGTPSLSVLSADQGVLASCVSVENIASHQRCLRCVVREQGVSCVCTEFGAFG